MPDVLSLEFSKLAATEISHAANRRIGMDPIEGSGNWPDGMIGRVAGESGGHPDRGGGLGIPACAGRVRAQLPAPGVHARRPEGPPPRARAAPAQGGGARDAANRGADPLMARPRRVVGHTRPGGSAAAPVAHLYASTERSSR